VKTYTHPDLRDIALPLVMQALADPGRLAIIRELLAAGRRPLACHEVKLKLSKATRSHHFEVLRAAGLIYTQVEGTKCMTSVRKTELNRHFPGLLKLVAGPK